MQVHLGVLVPAGVVEPIAALVEAAVRAPVAPAPAPRRGLFGRRAAPAAPVAAEPPVFPVPAAQVQIPIAAFGNLPTGDVHRLGEVLAEAAAHWPVPQLAVAGLDDGEQPGVVGVALAGDVEALREVARGVVRTVEGLGLFVDRRRFRPAVAVARQRPGAEPDGATIERLREALRSYRGAAWRVEHVSLLRVEHDAGVDRPAELRRLPLGAPD